MQKPTEKWKTAVKSGKLQKGIFYITEVMWKIPFLVHRTWQEPFQIPDSVGSHNQETASLQN